MGSSRFLKSDIGPLMLKDFLRDGGDDDYCRSCSSPSRSSPSRWLSTPLSSRSMAKTAATCTISKVVVGIVKMFSFAPKDVNYSSGERNGGRNDGDVCGEKVRVAEGKVKIRDILRGPAAEESRSLRRSVSSSTDSSGCCSKRSSCCGGCDFTAGDLQVWCGADQDEDTSHDHKLITTIPKGKWSLEDQSAEQQSPVSILDDSPFLEDDFESISSSRRSLFNDINTRGGISSFPCNKYSLSGRELDMEGNTAVVEEEYVTTDAIKERAKDLLRRVKARTATNAHESCKSQDDLLLDFFEHELLRGEDGEIFEARVVRAAKFWMDGEAREEWHELGSCLEEIEKEMCWNEFGNEREEMCEGFEEEVLDMLVVEILNSFL